MRYSNCLKLLFLSSVILSVITSSEVNNTNSLNSTQANNHTQHIIQPQETIATKVPEPLVETHKNQETQTKQASETTQETRTNQEPLVEQPRIYNEKEEESEYFEQGNIYFLNILIILGHSFHEEWANRMSDYEPDFVYMLQVEYKNKEIFYENIEKIPARVRGAILVDDDEENVQEIEIRIYSPSNEIVYQNATVQDIFEFTANEIGTYKIIFDNRYVNHRIRLTFTMSSGQNEILKKDHLTFVEAKVKHLVNFVHQNEVNHKMMSSVIYQRMQSNFINLNL
jgi:hypothetical protein